VKSDGLGDSVALVEDAQDRDALRHRSHSGLVHACGSRDIPRSLILHRFLLLSASARGKRQREQQWCGGLVHAYSGIQGS
jgi:hypothetical protein